MAITDFIMCHILIVQCDRLSATRSFINQLGVTRHMIIGPGCSSGAVTVAEISPFYNLTQVTSC